MANLKDIVDETNAAEAAMRDPARGAAEPTPASSSAIDFDAIIEDYTPETDIVDIVLPQGEILKARVFTSRRDKRKWQRKAAEWYSTLPKFGTPEAKKHPLAKFLPLSIEDAMQVHQLHTVMISPPLSLEQACKLLKAVELFDHIVRQYETKNKSMHIFAQNTIVDLMGKDSSETDTDDDVSPSAEEFGASTPTN